MNVQNERGPASMAESAKPLTVDAELKAIERVIREHLKT